MITWYELLATNAGRLSLNETGAAHCVQPASTRVMAHWIGDVMLCYARLTVLGLTEAVSAKVRRVFTHSLKMYAS